MPLLLIMARGGGLRPEGLGWFPPGEERSPVWMGGVESASHRDSKLLAVLRRGLCLRCQGNQSFCLLPGR